ncbi:hypothetical protein ACFL96_05345 [Thermoproteota archaeon]
MNFIKKTIAVIKKPAGLSRTLTRKESVSGKSKRDIRYELLTKQGSELYKALYTVRPDIGEFCDFLEGWKVDSETGKHIPILSEEGILRLATDTAKRQILLDKVFEGNYQDAADEFAKNEEYQNAHFAANMLKAIFSGNDGKMKEADTVMTNIFGDHEEKLVDAIKKNERESIKSILQDCISQKPERAGIIQRVFQILYLVEQNPDNKMSRANIILAFNFSSSQNMGLLAGNNSPSTVITSFFLDEMARVNTAKDGEKTMDIIDEIRLDLVKTDSIAHKHLIYVQACTPIIEAVYQFAEAIQTILFMPDTTVRDLLRSQFLLQMNAVMPDIEGKESVEAYRKIVYEKADQYMTSAALFFKAIQENPVGCMVFEKTLDVRDEKPAKAVPDQEKLSISQAGSKDPQKVHPKKDAAEKRSVITANQRRGMVGKKDPDTKGSTAGKFSKDPGGPPSYPPPKPPVMTPKSERDPKAEELRKRMARLSSSQNAGGGNQAGGIAASIANQAAAQVAAKAAAQRKNRETSRRV